MSYWLSTCDQCSHQGLLGAGRWDSALYLHWFFRKVTKITCLFLKEKAEYSLSIPFPNPEIHLHVPFLYCWEQVPADASSDGSGHPSHRPVLTALAIPLTEPHGLHLTANDPGLCSAMNDLCSASV